MPSINLTDDELEAVAATVRRAIEDDRYPHAPRLDPLKAALAKLEVEAAEPTPPPKALPLGQRLRTPAERRVHRRFVSAHCVLAGHDAFGQRVLGEVGAQARHSVGEPARADADERALLCPGQVFLTALHGSRSVLSRSGKVKGRGTGLKPLA